MVEVSFQHPRQAGFFRQGAVAALLLAALALSGCSDKQATTTPLDWWHNLEGGVIATQRPPPPGANDPYPNIATIPPRPPAADVAQHQAIADSLATQRDAANTAAAQAPLAATTPSPPSKPAAPPKPAAPDPNASTVVVDAASPTPTTPASPPPAPATPAQPAQMAESALPGIDSVPAVPAAVASGPLPDFATAPPPLPAGFGLPTVTPTPATPPPPVAMAKPLPNGVTIAFTPQSSTLPPSAALALQQFANAHKGAAVAVTGHGDTVLHSADAQSRALDLALRRAQTIAAFLSQAGMPAATLHLRAEAAGSGSTVALN